MKPNHHTEDLNPEDLQEQVQVQIDKDAFKGPFTCHGRKTQRQSKQMMLKGISFSYEAWACSKCGKEYLDTEQAKKLERIWLLDKLLHEKMPHFDRTINYDGKAFFFRFPKEITSHWHTDMKAHIELLTTNEFLVRIEETTTNNFSPGQ